jgi:hypothetical protein
MVEIQFEHEFKALYARNNKSKFKKNMRCFPQCLDHGHTENSFCGNAVQFRLSSSTLSDAELKSLIVLGGIRCSKEAAPMDVGGNIEHGALEPFMAMHGLIRGTSVFSHGEFTNECMVFPGTRKGWNYLWNNNKGRGKVCHYFWVLCLIVAPDQPGNLQCIGSSNSSEFEVCSSKRVRERELEAARAMKTDKTVEQTASSKRRKPAVGVKVKPPQALNKGKRSPRSARTGNSLAIEVSLVCAAFDKIAQEKEMLREFVNSFSLDEDTDAGYAGSGAVTGGCDMTLLTVPQESLALAGAAGAAAGGAGVKNEGYDDLEGLYTSVYSPSGIYNQVSSHCSSPFLAFYPSPSPMLIISFASLHLRSFVQRFKRWHMLDQRRSVPSSR